MVSLENVTNIAKDISQNILGPNAKNVDHRNIFPADGFAALRQEGLMGYFVPHKYGGLQGGVETYREVCSILGANCMATALLWAMHCQQVAVLANHASEQAGETLSDVAKTGCIIASVTTELASKGDLFSLQTPFVKCEKGFKLIRHAPVVSFGEQASYFLTFARASPESLTSDIKIAIAKPCDGQISKREQAETMGMRGAQNISMDFDVLIPKDRVLNLDFREAIICTMVPIIHVGWSAIWLGAARGAADRFLRCCLSVKGGKQRLKSDLFNMRLTNIRVQLDMADALLTDVTTQISSAYKDKETLTLLSSTSSQIAINNIKIAASRVAFKVMDELVELGGMFLGYSGNETRIEQVFRDLRSASIMFHNDRLYVANGKLIALENLQGDRDGIPELHT